MFTIDQNRLRAEGSCSYPEFISLVEYLVEQVFDKDVVFLRDTDSDPKKLPAPCITYKLISKVPGSIGKNTKEIKPRIRESAPDPHKPGHHVINYAQLFDTLIQFDIWGRNDTEADQLALRFEETMLQYTGFFIQNGVAGIYFDSQLEDQKAQNLRLDLSQRKLRYLVRFEKVTTTRTAEIEKIAANYKAKQLFGESSNDLSVNTVITK